MNFYRIATFYDNLFFLLYSANDLKNKRDLDICLFFIHIYYKQHNIGDLETSFSGCNNY